MGKLIFSALAESAPSWTDLQVSAGIYGGLSLSLEDIQAISWSDSVEVGAARGTGGKKRRRTTGQYDCEASITFYYDGWIRFRDELAKKRTDKRIALVPFDIVMNWTPPNSSKIFKVKIAGCRILGRGISSSEGSEPTMLEIPLSPMEVVEGDGVRLL